MHNNWMDFYTNWLYAFTLSLQHEQEGRVNKYRHGHSQHSIANPDFYFEETRSYEE